jgi:hypothetical protein
LEEFMIWIKFQFTGQMTFENHGTVWHYDHVIPCILFDHDTKEDLSRCWHWSNIRPMIGTENIAKNDKVSRIDISNHIKVIKAFISKEKLPVIEFDRYQYINN